MKKNNVIEAKSNMTWKQWSIEIEIQYKVQALHFKNCIRKKAIPLTQIFHGLDC